MKKIFNIILTILIILVIPLNVFACPHVDTEGNAHFQFYNSDYTIMTMMYPRDNHLYSKEVPIPKEFAMTKELENNILKEEFSFPLVQDKETYWSNYWFINNDLMDENWRDKNFKTTVEGLDSYKVNGKDYRLNVGLKNTFTESKKYINKNVTQMLYSVKVDKLNEDKDEKKYNKIVKDNKFDLDIPEIFKIDFEYYILTMEKESYKEKKQAFKTLYDDITIELKSTRVPEEVVAVNLDKPLTKDNQIPVKLNKDGYYEYTIKESGVYVLMRKNGLKFNEDKKISNDTIEVIKESNEKQKENNNKNSYIIFLVIVLSLLVGIIIMFKTFKNKTTE